MSLSHGFYLAATLSVLVLAFATAWKAGTQVIAANRNWTRAWLIFVSVVFYFGPSDWLVPIGALYVVVRHRTVWWRARPASADESIDARGSVLP